MRLMKRITSACCMLVFVAGIATANLQHIGLAASANLLANSGFESSASGTAPDDWAQDSWGTNDASFTYSTDAHTGNKAVETKITTYQDGDAKWLSTPVAVTPGATYVYQDYYKADATTNLWARYIKQDGSLQYTFLKSLPAATAYRQSTANITVPASVTQLSVFHVLASTGTMLMDDVSLVAVPDAAACTTAVNGLRNGDFEDDCPSDGGVPAGWSAVRNGNGTAQYSQTTNAYHGARAELIQNTSDGNEAGLTTAIVSPQAGQRYKLSFAQSGTTYVYAYAAYGLSDGTMQYQGLMSVPATLGVWSVYTDNFVAPVNTASLTITLATSGVGNVALDAVTLTPLANQNPSQFASGLVSLTFDDGDASTYANGFGPMKNYGYKGTYYLNAGSLNTTGYMTSAQVKALATNGQEVGSHLYHHSDIAQLDTPTLESELAGNIASLRRIIGTNYDVSSFASPYGSYTSGAIDTVMRYHASHRTTDGKMNSKADLNARQLHAYLVTPSTTAATITNWLAKAKADRTWLILVYHNIATSTADETVGEAGYNVTPAIFKSQLAAIKQSGLPVQTVKAALTSSQAQQ